MSTKRRILHIATALSWRGGEQQLAYLIQGLAAFYDQVVLCSKGSELEQHCIKQGIEYFAQKKRSGIDVFYAKKIRDICRNRKIDLCHLHDAHAHSFAILAADLWGNKTPLILSRRVDFPIKNKWSSKHKYNHPSIQKILCVSDAIAAITAKGIKEKSKITTVYSGVDLGKFSPRSGKLRAELNLNQDNFLVGNTSALADHKDYFTFLDAAEMVLEKEKQVCFVIMGDGPMSEEIKHYAQTKQHANRIVFTGFRNDIPTILADLDLFFISSKTEGLGTSIIDAFACRLPVVATAAGGIPELVEDEKTGLLRPIGQDQPLAEAILELIQNPEKAKKLADSAFIKSKEFSKEETARKTRVEYERLWTSL